MTIISKSTNLLLCDLYDLQRDGVMVDTSLILDDGELCSFVYLCRKSISFD